MNAVKNPRCPLGCRGRMRWVEDQWYCPVCGDEWGDEVDDGLVEALERLLLSEEWEGLFDLLGSDRAPELAKQLAAVVREL